MQKVARGCTAASAAAAAPTPRAAAASQAVSKRRSASILSSTPRHANVPAPLTAPLLGPSGRRVDAAARRQMGAEGSP
eukprot:202726-Chlamydomonas_euryale.AAC.4